MDSKKKKSKKSKKSKKEKSTTAAEDVPSDVGKRKADADDESGPPRKKKKVKSLKKQVGDFKRGGGKTTDDAMRPKATSKQTDHLFNPEKKKKKKSAQTLLVEQPNEQKTGKGNKRVSRIDPMNFKRLKVGMPLLVAVREVRGLEVLMSLPNNLTATLPITEVSEELTAELQSHVADDDNSESDEDGIPDLEDIFTVGQFVPCVISSLDDGAKKGKRMKGGGKKRVTVSTIPSKVNKGLKMKDLHVGMTLPASVTSVEDHGYVINLGMENVSGFLPKKSTDGELKVGFPVVCAVKTADHEARVVRVTARAKKVSAATISDEKKIKLQSIRPGCMVTAEITKKFDAGLELGFHGIFNGTVDLLHKGDVDMASNITKKNAGCTARVIWVDYPSKEIGLSLNASHVAFTPHDFSSVSIGHIFEEARVVRPYEDVGLILEGAAGEEEEKTMLIYVHISRVSDAHFKHSLEKRFPSGKKAKCRVIGFQYFDGVLSATMEKSVLEQEILRHDDVKVGEMATGVVHEIKPYGVLVNLTDSVKGLIPLDHTADIPVSNLEKRFKVGATVKCLVISVDTERRKITLSRKKTLIKSDLKKLLSYDDAAPGDFVYGTIATVKPFGCIMQFFAGVRGLAPVSELSTEYVQNPAEIYRAGQVVKCRVLDVQPAEEKLRLSFVLDPNTVDKAPKVPVDLEAIAAMDVGDVVSGKVSHIADKGLHVISDSGVSIFVPAKHLTDHPSFVRNFPHTFTVDQDVEVLVIGKSGESKVIATMKPLLVSAMKAGDMMVPSEISEIKPGMTCCGYVKDITTFGVFVAFLDGLSGLVSLTHISDHYVQDASKVVTQGQSVLTHVLSVDEDEEKMQLSLKGSLVGNNGMPYLASYLRDKGKLAELANPDVTQRGIGSTVSGIVKTVKDYGVVLDLDGTQAFVTPEQSKGVMCLPGSKVMGRVLDHDTTKNIVDVTIRSELQRIKKKKCKLAVGQTVGVVVELIKETYVVLSVPEDDNRFGFAAFAGFNSTEEFGGKVGGKGTAVVASLPSKDADAFSFLLLNDLSVKTSRNSKVAVSVEDLVPGHPVKAKILSIHDVQMNIKIGKHIRGRIHISEVVDDNGAATSTPFAGYNVNDTVDGKVMSIYDRMSNKILPISHQTPKEKVSVEVTIKPREVEHKEAELVADRVTLASLSKADTVHGYVQKVTKDCLWIAVSSAVRGRVFILDVSDDIKILKNVEGHYKPGDPVTCKVLSVDAEKGKLDLTIKGATASKKKSKKSLDRIKAGNIIPGRVSKVVLAKGLNVQLSSHTYARAFITDLCDNYDPVPTSGFKRDDFVLCRVLTVDRPNDQIDVSVRPSAVGVEVKDARKELEDAEAVNTGDIVSGYIKNVSNKGCFVSLGRNLVARVLIKNLSDAFIKDVTEVWQPGQLVNGRVLSCDHSTGKIELSLKRSDVVEGAKPPVMWSALKVGQKVKGTVKSVANYGVFLRVDNSNISGLCHISEINGEYIKNLGKIYSANDRVKALITQVDAKERRISFSLKKEHFEGDDDGDDDDSADVDEESEEGNVLMGRAAGDSSDDELDLAAMEGGEEEDESVHDDDSDSDSEVVAFEEDEEDVIDMEVTSKRKSKGKTREKKALQASLLLAADDAWDQPLSWDTKTKNKKTKDISSDDEDDAVDEENVEDAGDAALSKKLKRKKESLKKAEEARLRQREELLLDDGRLPETAEDFDRLILASPNSSYLWVRYMEFQLSLTEVEKARSVAEKAIKTISFREEVEKLNVWAALMNLENMYGTDESLLKVFRDALQFNDPLKVYEQLTRVYMQSGKVEEADNLFAKAVKKFKDTPSLWVQWGQARLKNDDSAGARAVMQKALQALPKDRHIQVICKFAQLEYRYGEPERGRTVFEEIVANYPKRVDLWSMYIDQELRVGSQESIRRLFERVSDLKLSSKKMQFFLTRYIEYEMNHGDEESVEGVREKARRYVESKQV